MSPGFAAELEQFSHKLQGDFPTGRAKTVPRFRFRSRCGMLSQLSLLCGAAQAFYRERLGLEQRGESAEQSLLWERIRVKQSPLCSSSPSPSMAPPACSPKASLAGGNPKETQAKQGNRMLICHQIKLGLRADYLLQITDKKQEDKIEAS